MADVPSGVRYQSIYAYCLPEERELAKTEQLGEELSEIEQTGVSLEPSIHVMDRK